MNSVRADTVLADRDRVSNTLSDMSQGQGWPMSL